MPEAQTKLTLTLDPDGKISIRSEGQFANDRTVLVWLLRQAETVILEGAVEAAFRSAGPQIALAKTMPPVPALLRR